MKAMLGTGWSLLHLAGMSVDVEARAITSLSEVDVSNPVGAIATTDSVHDPDVASGLAIAAEVTGLISTGIAPEHVHDRADSNLLIFRFRLMLQERIAISPV